MTVDLAVAVAALVFIGALVQRTVGLGFGLVTAPPLSLLWPELVPAALVLLSMPLTTSMAWADRGAVVTRDLGPALLGRAAGAGVGAALLAVIAPAALSLVVGIMVVCAVALSLTRPHVPTTAGWLGAAGVVSGIMGTTAGTGGPPLALAYQHASGPRLRGTLAAMFLAGHAMSLIALAVIGRVGAIHLGVALATLPLLAGGVWAGSRLASRLDGGRLRPAVLLVAGAAGMVAIARGVTATM